MDPREKAKLGEGYAEVLNIYNQIYAECIDNNGGDEFLKILIEHIEENARKVMDEMENSGLEDFI